MHKFMRRPQVEAATGLPTSTLYELIGKGEFPRPIKLTPRIVGWIEADVIAWQKQRLVANGRPVDAL
ncbi:AlpA family transcriptional regulator [Mesorhizobium sp.]|uniref:helix-turn-helix transcriptional regulator n=1 Tax=Mesorhizobium sp. TaxID=1871066 RepID=UPI000FE82187|nr:AlpA family phage regulatory protein [Mesorhizobium sp.]RWM27789.1 MAG: AlpA family phage regulatory protein [Mesorhizobium sp.]RWM39962.1 MAG: AlpA family phage regulatory protein [Mesorhizobium sp.]TJV53187.1 MAG: AlpA family phage regulatory protein [Mesorhizobium sp.]